ncbi:hypothetical protein SALBM135S_08604 [Streptomyces alboniger]
MRSMTSGSASSAAMARPTYSGECTTDAGPLPIASQAASTRSVRTNPGCSETAATPRLRRSAAKPRHIRSDADLKTS